MDPFKSNPNINNNEEDNNDDNSRRNDNNNSNPIHAFSSPPPLPALPPPPSQPSRPFWNFISPSAPSISHQLMFHASNSNNARPPVTYNNASALSLTLSHRTWNRSAIGRGSSIINSRSSHLLNHRPYTVASTPQPTPRRTPDQLISAATAAAVAAAQPSPFRSPPPPCTECGRRFPSSKALFGHMRCHPERTWRGINPPPNARPPAPPEEKAVDSTEFTGRELDVVEALLFLATGTEHKLERTSGTASPRGEEDNARSVGASNEQPPPAGPDLEEGEGGGGRSAASSSSTMRYVLDLNLPPPPEEDTEGGDGSDM